MRPDLARAIGARRRALAHAAQAQVLAARHGALLAQVGAAKGRIAQTDEIKVALSELQRREHARAVGAFEHLLTAFLTDVFPGGEREARLLLDTERGAPALDVAISKAGGELEDAMTGTGGGVTNVLSTGLRLIALTRSGNRPFLVLDEPDCWLETARVGAFAHVIQQAAQQIGIQVLMISHHPEQLLEAIPHRLRLERGADGLVVRLGTSCEPAIWDKAASGVRSVDFENCYGHRLTHLPLGPGVTLLTGGNDIGKSSLVSAMGAVLLGRSNDLMIRHAAPSARVRIDFGPDGIVEFERKRRGKPKVAYRLYAAGGQGEPLRTFENARELPDWLGEISGVHDVEGLNIQIGDQKAPVFLLGESPATRAKALAIGAEAGHVQRMLALDKQDITAARVRVNEGEAELEQIARRMRVLDGVDGCSERLAEVEGVANGWTGREERLARGHALVGQWLVSTSKTRQLGSLEKALERVVDIQALGNEIARIGKTIDERGDLSRQMRTLAAQWSRRRRRTDALQGILAAKAPEPLMAPASGVGRHILDRWQRVSERVGALVVVSRHEAPGGAPEARSGNSSLLLARVKLALRRRAVFARLGGAPVAPPGVHDNSVGMLAGRMRQANTACRHAAAELVQLDTQYAALVASTGGCCPTCGQALAEEIG